MKTFTVIERVPEGAKTPNPISVRANDHKDVALKLARDPRNRGKAFSILKTNVRKAPEVDAIDGMPNPIIILPTVSDASAGEEAKVSTPKEGQMKVKIKSLEDFPEVGDMEASFGTLDVAKQVATALGNRRNDLRKKCTMCIVDQVTGEELGRVVLGGDGKSSAKGDGKTKTTKPKSTKKKAAKKKTKKKKKKK